jgi:hypothetical protein
LALTCGGQAKDKPEPIADGAQNTGPTKSKQNLGTIIVYRQWSLGAAARPNWKFNVDNGPDQIVRNGTYLRVDVAPGDHVLDHRHMFLWGSGPQMAQVRTGETVYFQYVEAMPLVFGVTDIQAQAARTISRMRSPVTGTANLSYETNIYFNTTRLRNLGGHYCSRWSPR